MISVVVPLVLLLSLMLSAFFSGAETGLYCINRLRLELGVRQRDPRALRIAHMLQDEQSALCVTLIGTNLMNYVVTVIVAYIFADLLDLAHLNTELYTVLIVTPVVFVFGEVVPKNLFQRHADDLLPRASWLLALSDRIVRLSGLVWFLKAMIRAGNRFLRGDPALPELRGPKWHVAALLREAMAGQSHGQDRSDLVTRVCLLSETPLHAVMVPRNRTTVLNANANRPELIRVARRTGHSLFPVFDVPGRHVIGVIRLDDLLSDPDWQTVGERVDPAITVNPHDTVAAAIARLQAAERTLAVVADPSGRMLGIVTLLDLLREVIGDADTPS